MRSSIGITSTVITALLLLFSVLTANAQLLKGEIISPKHYKSWNSYYLVIENEMRTRATTNDLNNYTTFVIDFFPPNCNTEVSFILPFGDAAAADNFVSDINVSMRIDGGHRFELPAFSIISMGDNSVMITLNKTPHYGRLITEMKKGLNLQTKTTLQNTGESAYISYSLYGFIAAYTRALALCQGNK